MTDLTNARVRNIAKGDFSYGVHGCSRPSENESIALAQRVVALEESLTAMKGFRDETERQLQEWIARYIRDTAGSAA
jgi:hypothetical protein